MDNRISPRKNLKTRVIFEDEFGEDFLYFHSTDISLSGIFIESPVYLQMGTRVLLKFNLDEANPPLSIVGKVTRWVEPHRGAGRYRKAITVGIGIKFLDLTLGQIQEIEDFIGQGQQHH